jgi:hypothetical protein
MKMASHHRYEAGPGLVEPGVIEGGGATGAVTEMLVAAARSPRMAEVYAFFLEMMASKHGLANSSSSGGGGGGSSSSSSSGSSSSSSSSSNSSTASDGGTPFVAFSSTGPYSKCVACVCSPTMRQRCRFNEPCVPGHKPLREHK